MENNHQTYSAAPSLAARTWKEKRRGQPLTYLVFAVALIFLVPGLVWRSVPGDITLPLILSCLVTAYSGYRLTHLAFNRSLHFLQITFWLFVYCWLGLAVLAQTKSLTFPWPALRQSDRNLIVTSFAILAGIVAYEAGVYWKKRRFCNVPAQISVFTVPSFARFIFLTLICTGLSIGSIMHSGGFKTALLTRHDSTEEKLGLVQSTEKSDVLLAEAFQHNPPFIALLVAVYLLRYKRYPDTLRTPGLILTAALVIYNCVANFPPSLARVNLGSDLLAIIILLIAGQRRFKPVLVLGMVCTLTLLFPYLDYFRSESGYTLADIQNPAERLINKPDYDAFQMVSNTVSVVKDTGYNYGYNILASLLFFVPREVWSDKPFGTGQVIGEKIGYDFTNLSSPLWGEFYYAGGLLAVVFGFFVYGLTTSRLEGGIASAGNPAIIVLAYCAGYQIFLLRGDLLNAVAYSSLSLLSLACFLVDIGKLRLPLESIARRPLNLFAGGLTTMRPEDGCRLVASHLSYFRAKHLTRRA